MKRRAWRKVGYVVAMMALVYTSTASNAAFTSNNSQGGCERANITRQELYLDNQTAIESNTAIRKAVDNQGVDEALAADTRKAIEAQIRLTQPDAPKDEPWKVNCEKQYPNPLPWPS